MKYALQIYGTFRTFEKCLPDILRYIYFDRNDYDVFILSQKADGYSVANEATIRRLLAPHVITFAYIDDYPLDVLAAETQLCQTYQSAVTDAQLHIQPDLTTNQFVTKLWYRRYLNNEMRRHHQQISGVKYDWVIRTRFDVGFLYPWTAPLNLLLNQPDPQTVYVRPDVFSCGCPEVIDYESRLIEHWPYLYRQFKTTGDWPAPVSTMIDPTQGLSHFWPNGYLCQKSIKLCT